MSEGVLWVGDLGDVAAQAEAWFRGLPARKQTPKTRSEFLTRQSAGRAAAGVLLLSRVAAAAHVDMELPPGWTWPEVWQAGGAGVRLWPASVVSNPKIWRAEGLPPGRRVFSLDHGTRAVIQVKDGVAAIRLQTGAWLALPNPADPADVEVFDWVAGRWVSARELGRARFDGLDMRRQVPEAVKLEAVWPADVAVIGWDRGPVVERANPVLIAAAMAGLLDTEPPTDTVQVAESDSSEPGRHCAEPVVDQGAVPVGDETMYAGEDDSTPARGALVVTAIAGDTGDVAGEATGTQVVEAATGETAAQTGVLVAGQARASRVKPARVSSTLYGIWLLVAGLPAGAVFWVLGAGPAWLWTAERSDRWGLPTWVLPAAGAVGWVLAATGLLVVTVWLVARRSRKGGGVHA
jgi:hypothetical protein